MLRTKAVLSPCRSTFDRRMYGASTVRIRFRQVAEHLKIYIFSCLMIK
ncbi:hypothetical protein BACINT_01148 [Bacteroides intestinalis DSM 17393]|uniref:Uncharacterized protein n=1 Tax=Bacteroides intestinalis DSM 17393 TaxID=471870 RepID=B3C9I4_9BACE|nr:hypothetical protein BACINT_01148 [Bacteroides intestinalis DSM 17393]